MEVDRTVRVKLDVPEDRHEDLHQTIQQFQTAVNYTINHGENSDGYLILNKSTIHDEVYHDLRDRTDLPANLVVRGYSKAVEAMKATVEDWKNGESRPLPTFDQPTVVYDKRTLTINDESATLSTVDGRVEADFLLGGISGRTSKTTTTKSGWERSTTTRIPTRSISISSCERRYENVTATVFSAWT